MNLARYSKLLVPAIFFLLAVFTHLTGTDTSGITEANINELMVPLLTALGVWAAPGNSD